MHIITVDLAGRKKIKVCVGVFPGVFRGSCSCHLRWVPAKYYSFFFFFCERPADTRFYKKIGLEQRILFNKILVCRVWVIPDRDI